MQNITIETIQNDEIELCRELCNELMAFQKSRATIHPEKFDFMNFDTRMKKSCESAAKTHIAVAKDGNTPVGYVFSTIDIVHPAARNTFPDWAPAGKNYIGFYPDWVFLPQKIGCLNNLYLRDAYRGSGLGAKLCGITMQWLESFSDVDLIFVFISNGNEDAVKFYIKYGFNISHNVFGGFIKAAYKKRNFMSI